MGHVFILARTTFGWVARMPVYYVLLLAVGVLIYFSPNIALFEFEREANLVREIGFASMVLWAFLVTLLVCGPIMTSELEDRTALTLLSKPLSRTGFLMGKYMGLLAALAMGVTFLTLILGVTLWKTIGLKLLHSPVFAEQVTWGGGSYFGYVWTHFGATEGVFILQGALLAFLQVAILGAIAISLAAFVPVPVTVAGSLLLFILGNMTGYMREALGRAGSSVLAFVGDAVYVLLPNFGYLNLQDAISEGRVIRAEYLALATGYAGLYLACTLLLSCTLFARREIR